jgi:hypothetical protein
LLVGAFIIALVILGIVVMLNGIEFTENVGNQNRITAAEDAERTQQMIRRDLRQMLVYVGPRNEVTGYTQFPAADDLDENLTAYSGYRANMSVGNTGAYVNATLNDDRTHEGEFLVEPDPSIGYEKPDGLTDASWQVADDTHAVQGFVMNVSTETSGSGVTANVTDGTTEWNLTVLSDGRVFVNRSTGLGPTCTVSTDYVLVNVSAGEFTHPSGTGCGEFTFADGVTRPYDVYFTRRSGTWANGNYTMAVRTDDGGTALGFGAGSGDAYSRPVVMNPVVDVVFEDSALSYESELEVNTSEQP